MTRKNKSKIGRLQHGQILKTATVNQKINKQIGVSTTRVSSVVGMAQCPGEWISDRDIKNCGTQSGIYGKGGLGNWKINIVNKGIMCTWCSISHLKIKLLKNPPKQSPPKKWKNPPLKSSSSSFTCKGNCSGWAVQCGTQAHNWQGIQSKSITQ